MGWEPVAGAQGYVIQLRLKGRDTWTITALLRRATVGIWAIPNRDFEYRIRTICENGESEFSSVFEFSTGGGNLVAIPSSSRNSDLVDIDIDLREHAEFNPVSLSVSPNPFLEEINLDYEVQGEEALLTIYHVNGQKVFEQVLTKEAIRHNISLGELTPGLFLLTIQEEGQPMVTSRIAKQ